MNKRIPVIVISGFLGSGKTTLLVRLLKGAAEHGLRPGVLMNELGKLDVDGHILEEHANASVQKLLDGCVCCSRKEELLGALKSSADQRPDLIVIELTGVANPEEIAETITEPELQDILYLRHVVTVLDGEHILDYNSLFAADKQLVRTLRRQIEVADRLLLNKTDLIPPAKQAKIEKTIRKYNDRAPLYPTTQSRMDLSPLFADIESAASPAAAASSQASIAPKAAIRGVATVVKRQETKSFSRIQTISLPWNRTGGATRSKVEKFLRAWDDRLLRAKGYICFGGDDSVYLMQYAGQRTVWERSRYASEPYVVFIGIDLDEDRLAEQWSRIFD
ncbi:CobW family GTP-binding protein [Paenibacillus mesophilus]|uniref:CobW family GTP-binding protein n=1 Tax=Paenibacillus mesophilus TaxID=2582849 RepID=UPI00192E7306|nr:GTP-binding protein [Paenibacillus mesophilus]